MTKIFLFFLIIGFGLMFVSCQKDTDIFIPNTSSTGLDTNWVAAVTDKSPISEIKSLLNKEISLDSIDASGGTFQTSAGLTVTILAQSLLLTNGQQATGKIYIETLLIKQKGDMIKVDKPTTSFGRVLISGGEIFIKVRKENEELHLANGKGIYIKYVDPSASSLMKLFYGDESVLERFNWVAASSNQTSNGGIDTTRNPAGYQLFSTQLRWINCDYFADSSGSRINITASLPADYTNANTSVYLVFKDINAVAGMYGDMSSKKFTSPKIPVGKSAIIISITKKGNNSYYLGHETITTGQTNNNGTQTVILSPQPTSITDIKAYLGTL